MSYVLVDKARNKFLAVVGEGSLAEWIKVYYENVGVRVGLSIHESVLCETIDEEIKPIIIFDI